MVAKAASFAPSAVKSMWKRVTVMVAALALLLPSFVPLAVANGMAQGLADAPTGYMAVCTGNGIIFLAIDADSAPKLPAPASLDCPLCSLSQNAAMVAPSITASVPPTAASTVFAPITTEARATRSFAWRSDNGSRAPPA